MTRRSTAVVMASLLCASLLPIGGLTRALAQAPSQERSPVAPGRETEPVVLTGTSFPSWATLGDVALEAPHSEGKQCYGQGGKPAGEGPCSHNQYEDPDFSSSDYLKNEGVPVDRLLGYHWTGERFEQIPFQVDEMFQHYISNNNSGFAAYSETDPHTTYAFDREGFRWTKEDPDNPCLARPASEPATDPVPGLDTDDELVFMASDARGAAPEAAALPPGIEDSYQIAVADPTNGKVSYVYVMRSAPDGPAAAFDETNGYVRYERDADSNVFLFSQSSYKNYGATEKGAYFDPATGTCVTEDDPTTDEVEYPLQHRPGDQATITTPRYRFRYEGRWLLTELQVSKNDDWNYGPDLVDQWKARAFQQRPSGQTPCCGFEEEVNNWGGSSILMGELAGPVRTIRETWGADSGTNVVRREIFYRDEIRMIAFLRVHVIPPLDGIYAQWDYNAGMVDTYYNPYNPGGVPIDGKNDERFGNSRIHVGPDGISYDGNDQASDALDDVTGSETQGVGTTNEPSCSPTGPYKPYYDQLPAQLRNELEDACIYNDIDSPDPTFSGANAGLNWEQVEGRNGTLVFRSGIKHVTPGAAHLAVAVPYYRDDSCFDDGTGSNPGPHLRGRGVDDGEFAQYDSDGDGVLDAPRQCWEAGQDAPPPPEGDRQYLQGSIGTHGVHILLIADSDNASSTVPLTEIDTEQRIVVLPPTQGSVGETYGRHSEKPLVPIATAEDRDRSELVATTIEITGATSGQITDSVTLAARFSGENGPVAGEQLTFTLRRSIVGTATTDADGVASLEVTLDPPAEQTELTVAYAGDEQRAASNATAPFEIELEDSSMALTITRDGGTYIARAVLTETDTGGGVAGRTIELFLNGASVGSGVSDSDGSATFSLPRSEAKTGDNVTASFAGDDIYLPAQAQQTVSKN